MAVLMLAACTPVAEPKAPVPGEPASSAPAPADPAPEAKASLELGKLESRDHTVTIYRGDRGLEITITDRAGATLLNRGASEEFEQRYPELFQLYEASFARGQLDARVDRQIQADL